MSWVCIRKATDEDYKRLQERLEAFATRHEIFRVYPEQDIEEAIMNELEEERQYLGKWGNDYYLYCQIIARALGHPDATGIAYGYIGHPEKH